MYFENVIIVVILKNSKKSKIFKNLGKSLIKQSVQIVKTLNKFGAVTFLQTDCHETQDRKYGIALQTFFFFLSNFLLSFLSRKFFLDPTPKINGTCYPLVSFFFTSFVANKILNHNYGTVEATKTSCCKRPETFRLKISQGILSISSFQ